MDLGPCHLACLGRRGRTLAWDSAVLPAVLVLDAGTGRYCATLAPGSVDFADAGAKELDLLLPDGIRTTRVRIPAE